MQNEHRFRLKPYKVPSDRTECPNCHHRRCFVPYVDTEGRITFPPYVGRCNRENKCGTIILRNGTSASIRKQKGN